MRKTPVKLGALFILLVMLAGYTPLSGIAALFAPTPLILLWLRAGWKPAYAVSLAAFVMMAIGGDWMSVAVVMIAVTGFSGVLAKGFATNRLGQMIPLASLIITGLYLAGLAELKIAGYPVVPFIVRQATFLTGSSALTVNGGILQQVNLYMPGIVILMGVIVTLVQVTLLRFIYRKQEDKHPVLRHIRFPRSTVLLFAVSLLAMSLPVSQGVTLLSQVVNNVWLITTFLITLQALSLVWWVVRKRTGSIAWMCLALALDLTPLCSELYVLIGVTDILFDVRKRLPK